MNFDDDDGETICETEDEQQNEKLKAQEDQEFKSPIIKNDDSPSVALTESTEKRLVLNNKYALFEEYLAFLTVEKEANGSPKMLNAVLLGYWCNLFKSLVQTHAQEVFIYVYEHQELLDRMLDHLYSP